MIGKDCIVTKNDKGQIVLLQGLLPNGNYGVVGDEDRPFAEEELNNADMFQEHIDDLDKRLEQDQSARTKV